jgi:hypothetical protein
MYLFVDFYSLFTYFFFQAYVLNFVASQQNQRVHVVFLVVLRVQKDRVGRVVLVVLVTGVVVGRGWDCVDDVEGVERVVHVVVVVPVG